VTSPLVPENVDLRDFHYMPLDVVRLRDSSLAALSTGEQFRCAVLLWCASWHQLPAASLPDDDALLAQLAGFGRAVRDWRKVRDGALRGWIGCDDGRLYHPVVAEKALEAWSERLKQRWRTECARLKKAAQRAGNRAEYPTFDEWRAHFEATGQEQFSPTPVPGTVPTHVPGDTSNSPGDVTRETHSKGREGKGRDIYEAESDRRARESDSPPNPSPAVTACLLIRQRGCTTANPHHPELLAAIAEGVTPEALDATYAEGVAAGKRNPFAWAITTARSRHADGAQPIAGAPHAARSPSRPLSAVERVEHAIASRKTGASPEPGTVVEGAFVELNAR
jgi:hypothetical protein